MTINLKNMSVSNKVTEDEIYLDVEKANSIELDIKTQLARISKATEQAYNLLKKAESTKEVKKDLKEATRKAKEGLKTRSKKAKEFSNDLENKYTKDVQDFVSTVLLKSLKRLEARVAALEKQN